MPATPTNSARNEAEICAEPEDRELEYVDLKDKFELYQDQLSETADKSKALEHQLLENEAVEKDVRFLIGLSVPLTFWKCVGDCLLLPKDNDGLLSDVKNRINFIKSEIRILNTSAAVVNDKLEAITERLKKMNVMAGGPSTDTNNTEATENNDMNEKKADVPPLQVDPTNN